MTDARPSAMGSSGRPAGALSPPRTGRRTEAELTLLQVQAIDAWHLTRKAVEEAAGGREASREVRMDLTRQREVLRAQHAAIVARTDRQLSASVQPLARRAPLRAVVVHRNDWFVGKVATELESCGVVVLDVLANGADAVGVVVAEQPDLLLVEDVLPMLPGEQVVRETRRFSPGTLVVAQVAYADRAAAMLAAGATTTFTRQVPPQDLARDVVGLLTEGVAVPGQSAAPGSADLAGG